MSHAKIRFLLCSEQIIFRSNEDLLLHGSGRSLQSIVDNGRELAVLRCDRRMELM